MLKTKLLFGIAAALSASGAMLLAAGPAAARDVTVTASIENDVPVARVSYADLDLAHRPGQVTLRQRVSGAIRTVCEPSYDSTEPTGNTQCVNAAWGQAQPQMAAAVARAGRLASGTATDADRALAMNGTIKFGVQ
ncbi:MULTISPECIES: UrcA family protein [Sphingomonas]|uniref:UrcA family protein n=1 Tax=Sphingomonas TaxID=13687 RepID=UPI000DEF3D86|nr:MULTISPECIES: UrcA family protein [Sphingomonas]